MANFTVKQFSTQLHNLPKLIPNNAVWPPFATTVT